MGALWLPLDIMNVGYLNTPMGAFEIASDGEKLKYIKLLNNQEKTAEMLIFWSKRQNCSLQSTCQGSAKILICPLTLHRGQSFSKRYGLHYKTYLTDRPSHMDK